MIKIGLIAGSKTDTITKYIMNSGTFDIRFGEESILESFGYLSSNIIEIDKLVLVYLDDSVDVGKDFKRLFKLLSGTDEVKYMFKVKQIIYFHNENVPNNLNLFKHVMKETGFSDFKVHKFNENVNLMDISSKLMNETKNVNTNSMLKVYRRRRNSSLNVIFEEEINDEVIEPYDLENVKEYNKRKIQLSSYNNIEYEDNEEQFLKKNDNLSIPRYNEISGLKNRNMFIFTGKTIEEIMEEYSYVFSSASKSEKNVVILNTTGNQSLKSFFRNLGVEYNNVSSKDILTNDGSYVNGINYVETFNKRMNFSVPFLLDLLDKYEEHSERLLIVLCSVDDVDKILELVKGYINKIYYSIEKSETLILNDYSYIKYLGEDNKVVCLLREGSNRRKEMELNRIKELLGENVSIIKPIVFDGAEETSEIFDTLLGIGE